MRLRLNRRQLEAIEKRAAEVRAQLRIADEPVADIVTALETYGLTVFVQPLGSSGPDGAYVPRQRIRAVLLNGDSYLPRLRFTAAHELAHDVFKDGLRVDQNVREEGDQPERRANAFAAHFLMPRTGIATRLAAKGPLTPDVVAGLASDFGVSYRALLFHLQNLRVLSPQRRVQLQSEKSSLVAHRFAQPSLPLRRLPPDYVQRSLRAYSDYRLSFDRLAELLQIEPPELASSLATGDFPLHPEDLQSQESNPTVSQ